MKTIDFIEIVERGLEPIITMDQATYQAVGIDTSGGVVMGYSHNLEEGMLGRIKSVEKDISYGLGFSIRSKDSSVWFYVDFLEFAEYNNKFEKWRKLVERKHREHESDELKKYAVLCRSCKLYEGFTPTNIHDDLKEFKFDESIPENKLLVSYLESGTKQTFTRWMEDQLTEKQTKQ